jgi:hypothetical protein
MVAEAHRGRIFVEENQPKGAIFTIELWVMQTELEQELRYKFCTHWYLGLDFEVISHVYLQTEAFVYFDSLIRSDKLYWWIPKSAINSYLIRENPRRSCR